MDLDPDPTTGTGRWAAVDDAAADARRASPSTRTPIRETCLVRPDEQLALIDFGAMGRLDRFERSGLIDMMRGLQTEDPSLLREAALRIGTHTNADRQGGARPRAGPTPLGGDQTRRYG